MEQIQNALCVALALIGLAALLHRARVAAWLTGACVALFAASYGVLHLALDPFLFYWPPSLAAITWATYFCVLAKRGASRAFAGALVLATLACWFNPMTAGASVALGVTFFFLRADAGQASKRAVAVWSAVLGLVPAGGLVVWEILIAPSEQVGVLYGRWRPDTFDAAVVASRLVLTTPYTDDPGALSGFAEGAAILVLVGWLVSIARSHRRRAALPLTCAAVLHAGLVAWWDPGQPFFWLLVPWLVLLSFGVARGTRAEDPAFDFAFAPVVVAATLATAWQNARGYLAHGLQPSEAQAARVADARRFSEHDLLVFRDSGQLGLEYWTGVHTSGWVSMYAARDPGETTWDVFERAATGLEGVDGSVWVQVDEAWQPEIAPEAAIGVAVDVDPRQLARIIFGDLKHVGDLRMRQVLGISEHTPCSLPAERVVRGIGVRASSADESALNDDYAAWRSIDGARDSEWHASNGGIAWIDLHFDPPRRAKNVFLLNARNPGYADRATLGYEVLLVSPSGKSRSFTGRYPGYLEHPKALRIPAEGELACVRAWVLSWYGLGGGFAEIWTE